MAETAREFANRLVEAIHHYDYDQETETFDVGAAARRIEAAVDKLVAAAQEETAEWRADHERMAAEWRKMKADVDKLVAESVRVAQKERDFAQKAFRELQEIGPCGKHLKIFWRIILRPTLNPEILLAENSGYCAECTDVDKLVAEARLEEAEWWFKFGCANNDCDHQHEHLRLAALRSPTKDFDADERPLCPVCGLGATYQAPYGNQELYCPNAHYWKLRSPAKDAPLGSSTNDAEFRCLVTGNSCGTDTWMLGRQCKCNNCQAYLAGKAGR